MREANVNYYKIFKDHPLPWQLTNSAYLDGNSTKYMTIVDKNYDIVFSSNKEEHYTALESLVLYVNNAANP